MRNDAPSRATQQDGTYPRPQLLRAAWHELNGEWDFRFGDGDFDHRIIVPFPPESPLSGIGDTAAHPVCGYRRTVTASEVAAAGYREGDTLLLHFGAVDYRADVWINDAHLASHTGGHTPFSLAVPDPAAGFTITVRVEDHADDLSQPRGKQDWADEPHEVWYQRTTGIWQPVWLEAVPAQHVRQLHWVTPYPDGHVVAQLELAQAPTPGTVAQFTLRLDDEVLGEVTAPLTSAHSDVVVAIPALSHGQARRRLLWSQGAPTLIDAAVTLSTPTGHDDTVASYLGIRTVGVAQEGLTVNGHPTPMRAVLSQGYWPESHLAAPSADALRAEVQLTLDLGFTAARVHQKIEDPRLLFWADKLGLMLWEEMPSCYEFSPRAARRLVDEWLEAVERDRSHPSIVVWVPFNESWGVDLAGADPAQAQHIRALYHLTHAVDRTRPAIGNDGWEQNGADIVTVHDYRGEPEALTAAYGTRERAVQTMHPHARGVHGRLNAVGADADLPVGERPIMLTEWGGYSFDPAGIDGSWGYGSLNTIEGFREYLRGMFAAIHGAAGLSGWCYTQLTDTRQETNGLTDEHRQPKLPIDELRAIIRGRGDAS